MASEASERHQLAGMDESERGFTRLVEIERLEAVCRASFRYEDSVVVSDGAETAASALKGLVDKLQARGYTHLKSQLAFRDDVYLGSQEPWVDYPDPERPIQPSPAFFGWFRRLFSG